MEKELLMEKVYSIWPSISEDSIVTGKKVKLKPGQLFYEAEKIMPFFKK